MSDINVLNFSVAITSGPRTERLFGRVARRGRSDARHAAVKDAGSRSAAAGERKLIASCAIVSAAEIADNRGVADRQKIHCVIVVWTSRDGEVAPLTANDHQRPPAGPGSGRARFSGWGESSRWGRCPSFTCGSWRVKSLSRQESADRSRPVLDAAVRRMHQPTILRVRMSSKPGTSGRRTAWNWQPSPQSGPPQLP